MQGRAPLPCAAATLAMLYDTVADVQVVHLRLPQWVIHSRTIPDKATSASQEGAQHLWTPHRIPSSILRIPSLEVS
jgi:hypothetical protein